MRELTEAYAFLRRCADAVRVRERLRGVLRSLPRRAEWPDWAGDRLNIALRCGDYAGAVAWADTLIRNKWDTRAWFRIDPALAPLRGRADFERLIAGN